MKPIALAVVALSVVPIPMQAGTLESRVDEIRERMDVPGLSVSAVHRGEIVLMHGSGVRRAGQEGQVTPRTRFALASITKSLTALALASAVAHGELSWSDRLHDRVEGFVMKTPEATLGATIDHVVSHRTGMGYGGLLGLHPPYDRRELVTRLDRVDVIAPLGATYSYNNLIYSALGLVFEDGFDQTWEQAIESRILVPLQMTRTTPFGGDPTWTDVASPHAVRDGRWEPKPGHGRAAHGPVAIGPASRAVSTAEDMAKLMLALLSEDAMRPLLVDTAGARAQIRPSDRGWMRSAFPGADLFAYGRGWFLASREGKRVVYHPGGGGGTAALLLLMPDDDFGVTILSNNNDYAAIFAVAHTVADNVLGVDGPEWATRLESLKSDTEQAWADIQAVVSGRPADPHPPLALASYAGTYEHEVYGPVEIELEDGRLTFRRGAMTGELEHWDRDSFLLTLPSSMYLYDFITFTVGIDRRPMALMVWDEAGFVASSADGH